MENKGYWIEKKEQFDAFYQTNKKIILGAVAAIVAIVGVSIYWSNYYMPSQEKEASTKLAPLYYYFKNDSNNIVINGDKSKKIISALKIADKYGSTKKGKEAALMAAISLMREKKYDQALDYIAKTGAKDRTLNAAIINMEAVCHSNLGDPSKAASLFKKASSLAENEFSAEYLKRAGMHYEAAKEFDNALSCYEEIESRYPTTSVGTDIGKYVAKMKAKLGEFNP